MHIRFHRQGAGSARAAADYLVGERDSTGRVRPGVEVLRGNPDHVADVADSLDVPSRAQLPTELPSSLDGPTDPGAAAACAAEIEQRAAAIEAGTVNLEAWTDVRSRIEREMLNR